MMETNKRRHFVPESVQEVVYKVGADFEAERLALLHLTRQHTLAALAHTTAPLKQPTQR